MNQPLFQEVKDIINKYDPIGLLKMSSPVNEYDPECEMIVPKLIKANNIDEVHDMVYNTFVDMFNSPEDDITGPKEDYRKLSEELYSLKVSEN